MIELSVAGLARLLQTSPAGVVDPAVLDRRIDSVVIDSRAVGPGALFMAFPGEHVDGHDYVRPAFDAGAVAAVTTHEIPGGCCLVVPDVQQALGVIGRHNTLAAKRHGLRVVGLTGSQGKTSTKDLLAQILERVGATVAPRASLNNEIGVPLTATQVRAETRFLVAEMGARGIGHIRYLCELTPPDVGLVLNVGTAHLGEFGSRQAIAQGKGELVEALSGDGHAVLNLSDPLVSAMHTRTSAQLVGFCEPGRPRAAAAEGLQPRWLVQAEEVAPTETGGWNFVLDVTGPDGRQRLPVSLGLLGRHQIGNALAATGAALAVGAEPELIAAALSDATLRSHWRMEATERGDGLLVVNDAYNANPSSVRAALLTLAELGRSRRDRRPAARTVAVLGDMLELGVASADEHASVGRLAAEQGIDRLVAVGDFAQAMIDGALAAGYPKENASMHEEAGTAIAVLTAELEPADVVLVKASRAVGLEVVAERLLAAQPTAGAAAGTGPTA